MTSVRSVSAITNNALTRRNWLRLTGAIAGSAAIGELTSACQASGPADAAPHNRTHPIHVALTAPQRHGALGLLRLASPAGFRELRGLAEAAGEAPGVSFGVSARLLPELASLTSMPTFPGDVLEPDRTGTDICLLCEGSDPRAVMGLLESLTSRAASWATPTWHAPLAQGPTSSEAGHIVTTNALGFREGFGNPTRRYAAAETLLGRDQPTWARGGALLALRIIRLSTEMWESDGAAIHGKVIGRNSDGSWLNHEKGTRAAPFAHDPGGQITPLTSHVRKANPRTASQPHIQITRRSWPYRRGTEVGTAFMAFTDDLRKFDTVQRRVLDDALAPFTLTTGGGYFYVPAPGTRWLELLSSAT